MEVVSPNLILLFPNTIRQHSKDIFHLHNQCNFYHYNSILLLPHVRYEFMLFDLKLVMYAVQNSFKQGDIMMKETDL